VKKKYSREELRVLATQCYETINKHLPLYVEQMFAGANSEQNFVPEIMSEVIFIKQMTIGNKQNLCSSSPEVAISYLMGVLMTELSKWMSDFTKKYLIYWRGLPEVYEEDYFDKAENQFIAFCHFSIYQLKN
jgi:hypothetical protein